MRVRQRFRNWYWASHPAQSSYVHQGLSERKKLVESKLRQLAPAAVGSAERARLEWIESLLNEINTRQSSREIDSFLGDLNIELAASHDPMFTIVERLDSVLRGLVGRAERGAQSKGSQTLIRKIKREVFDTLDRIQHFLKLVKDNHSENDTSLVEPILNLATASYELSSTTASLEDYLIFVEGANADLAKAVDKVHSKDPRKDLLWKYRPQEQYLFQDGQLALIATSVRQQRKLVTSELSRAADGTIERARFKWLNRLLDEIEAREPSRAIQHIACFSVRWYVRNAPKEDPALSLIDSFGSIDDAVRRAQHATGTAYDVRQPLDNRIIIPVRKVKEGQEQLSALIKDAHDRNNLNWVTPLLDLAITATSFSEPGTLTNCLKAAEELNGELQKAIAVVDPNAPKVAHSIGRRVAKRHGINKRSWDARANSSSDY